MTEEGSRKVTALLAVIVASLIVSLVLAAVTVWGHPEAVGAAVGPIALMWGGVAGAAIATFNGANAVEHYSAGKAAEAVSAGPTGPTGPENPMPSPAAAQTVVVMPPVPVTK